MFFSVINPLYLKHTQSQTGQLTVLKIRYQQFVPEILKLSRDETEIIHEFSKDIQRLFQNVN